MDEVYTTFVKVPFPYKCQYKLPTGRRCKSAAHYRKATDRRGRVYTDNRVFYKEHVIAQYAKMIADYKALHY